MRFAAVLTVAALFASHGAAAADDLTTDKRADIRRLIGVTGGTRISGQLADLTGRHVATTLRKSRPDIPERVYPAINRELANLFAERADAPGGLVERLVAIYHGHFSHAEIRELLAFNETPIGRKTLQVLPAIMNESLAAGQSWGQSLAPEVQRRIDAVLRQEGVAPARRGK